MFFRMYKRSNGDLFKDLLIYNKNLNRTFYNYCETVKIYGFKSRGRKRKTLYTKAYRQIFN